MARTKSGTCTTLPAKGGTAEAFSRAPTTSWSGCSLTRRRTTLDEEGLAALSQMEARTLIQELRERGVKPAPTGEQINFIEQLVRDLELTDEELKKQTGVDGIASIETTDQASRVIDELQRLRDERQPPSADQRRFIASLIEETGISKEEAAALVGLESLDQLTGGDRSRVPTSYPRLWAE